MFLECTADTSSRNVISTIEGTRTTFCAPQSSSCDPHNSGSWVFGVVDL